MTLEAWMYPTVMPTGWNATIERTWTETTYGLSGSNNRPTVGGTLIFLPRPW